MINQNQPIQCAGRFCLTIPAGFDYDPQASRYTMQSVLLKEVSWSPLDQEAPATTLASFQQEMARIRAESYKIGPEGTVLESREFIPDRMKGVRIHGVNAFKDPQLNTFEWRALVWEKEGGLILSTKETGWERSEGQLKQDNLLAIGTAWKRREHPQLPPQPMPGQFYLHEGHVQLPYLAPNLASQVEEVQAVWRNPGLDLNLIFQTAVESEPETLSLLDRFAEELVELASELAGEIRTIRSRTRTVAGVRGEELVIVSDEGDDGLSLSCVWRTSGKADSGQYPAMEILLTGPANHLDLALESWNATLQSIRSVEESPKPLSSRSP
jgi:hypothetical protein